MDMMFECPDCHKWVRPQLSECQCTPQRLYSRVEEEGLRRQADTQLSGNGAGLGVRRPIPDTQG